MGNELTPFGETPSVALNNSQMKIIQKLLSNETTTAPVGGDGDSNQVAKTSKDKNAILLETKDLRKTELVDPNEKKKRPQICFDFNSVKGCPNVSSCPRNHTCNTKFITIYKPPPQIDTFSKIRTAFEHAFSNSRKPPFHIHTHDICDECFTIESTSKVCEILENHFRPMMKNGGIMNKKSPKEAYDFLKRRNPALSDSLTSAPSNQSQKMCNYFNTLKGCRNGEDCPFQHVSNELRKSKLIRTDAEEPKTYPNSVVSNTYPDWWNTNRGSNQTVKYIKVNWENGRTQTELFVARAVDEFFKTVKRTRYEIVEAYVIQNQEIWSHHDSLETNWLKSKRLTKDTMNIKLLWHGTSSDIVKKIAEKGFLRDYNESHRYGRGVYFAKEAVYSVTGYLRFDNPQNNGELLYCRVICGESVAGQEGDRRPSDKTHVKGMSQEYETMVNDERNPIVFVTANDHQSYPALKLIVKKI